MAHNDVMMDGQESSNNSVPEEYHDAAAETQPENLIDLNGGINGISQQFSDLHTEMRKGFRMVNASLESKRFCHYHSQGGDTPSVDPSVPIDLWKSHDPRAAIEALEQEVFSLKQRMNQVQAEKISAITENEKLKHQLEEYAIQSQCQSESLKRLEEYKGLIKKAEGGWDAARMEAATAAAQNQALSIRIAHMQEQNQQLRGFLINTNEEQGTDDDNALAQKFRKSISEIR